MANIVSDVLDDGTIHVFDIDVSQAAAEAAIDSLRGQQGTVINFDFAAAIFSTFVETVHILTASGWTTEDLICEVVNHSEADDVTDYLPRGSDDDYDDDD